MRRLAALAGVFTLGGEGCSGAVAGGSMVIAPELFKGAVGSGGMATSPVAASLLPARTCSRRARSVLREGWAGAGLAGSRLSSGIRCRIMPQASAHSSLSMWMRRVATSNTKRRMAQRRSHSQRSRAWRVLTRSCRNGLGVSGCNKRPPPTSAIRVSKAMLGPVSLNSGE